MHSLFGEEMRIQVSPRVRAAAASGVQEALRRIGADPGDIFRLARVKEDDLSAPQSWLRLADYCDLFEQIANRSGIPAFGLKLGLERHCHILGDLGVFATSSPTVYSALDAIAANFGILQEHTDLTLGYRDRQIVMTYKIRNGHILHRRQDAELSLGAFIGCLRLSLGSGWAPDEVHFEHARPSNLVEYEALIGAPVYFGQAGNTIIFSADAAEELTPSPDPRLCAEMRRAMARRQPLAHEIDFVGVVLQEIRDGYASGRSGADHVAATLGLSAPALYRRLKACGTEFSELQRNLREELALAYAREPHLPFTEIALALGYSELSAFSRAFRAWTGVSPNVYRQAAGRGCVPGGSLASGPSH